MGEKAGEVWLDSSAASQPFAFGSGNMETDGTFTISLSKSEHLLRGII